MEGAAGKTEHTCAHTPKTPQSNSWISLIRTKLLINLLSKYIRVMVLVSSAAGTKSHKLDGSKQQNFLLSCFSRPEVKNEGFSRAILS